jgi:GNAT superfamily N-acetyltransferase
VLRPLTSDDADAVVDLMDAAWGVPSRPPGLRRVRHLINTDPGGAWATEHEGAVVGAALALLREGLWGLSLLIVRADHQSAGHGRELMRAATAYGADAPAGIILSSDDPRALRSYWRAGFTLRPSLDAKGAVARPPRAAPTVREARWPHDRELVDGTSREVRGAAHGPDIDALLATGRRLLVHDGGGFVAYAPDRLALLAATDDRVARELLETVLSDAEPSVEFLDARQDWAIDVVLEAGMALAPSGATCVRGAVGPMRPYIPSGAYL